MKETLEKEIGQNKSPSSRGFQKEAK